MFCHTCGSRNAIEDRVCLACGRPLPVGCGGCGAANPARARYCACCGAQVGGVAANMRAALQSQPPTHLLDRANSARRNLEGERKRVTVMFADIKGSLSLIAGRDAEQAQGLLDSLLETMTDAVHEYEGTVNQVLGDGFVALFGAPIAHEDHAVRAAYAALSIQAAVREGHRLWQSLGVAPQVRIGLSSGEVVIRAIDNDLNVDYRAVGRTTHLAARMEQTASPGAIRMTAETMRLVEGLVQAESVGPVTIKGLDEPVDVFELKAALFSKTRLQVRSAQGLSPLVGRSRELTRLIDLVSGLAHRSAVVGLRGEAGVGKSRLVHEVVRAPVVSGVVTLEARALSFRRKTPFVVLQTLLRSCLGVDESDDPVGITAKLDALLPADAQRRTPLLSLLGGAADDRDFRRLDPAERRKQTMEALDHLLRSLCAQRPVVLVVEDLHWCDTDSLAFFQRLFAHLPERRLLILTTYRTEFQSNLFECVQEIVLSALSQASAKAMVRELIGVRDDARLEARLSDLLVERTHGNPFFIEECLRSLVDSQAVVANEDGTGYRVLKAEAGVDLPDTAEAVLAARIDRLPAEVKSLLQAASVIGTETPMSLLEQVADLSDQALSDAVAGLVTMGMLRQTQATPARYRFEHSLTHETAYRSLLRRQRCELHRRVVSGLEKLYPERLAEFSDQLADHTQRGEQWDKAVRYNAMYSAQAASQFANHEAVAAIERGLSALAYLPPGKERDQLAVDLRLSALAGLMPLGQRERMVSMLREAELIALQMNDPMRLAAVYSQLSTALWLVSRHEPALESGLKALEIADELGYFPLRLSARYNVAMCHSGLGQYEQAIDILAGLAEELEGANTTRRFGWATYPSVACATFLGLSQVMLGRLDEALANLQRGRAAADRLRHPYSQAIVMEELGYCHIVRGELSEARSVLQACIDICEQHEVHTMYPAAAGRLGLAMVLAGEVESAIALLEDALTRKTYEAGSSFVYFYLVYALSRARLSRGDYAEALAHANNAVDTTRRVKEHGHHVCSLLLLADVQLECGDLTAAETVYGQALAGAQRLGMRPAAAACRKGLQRVYAQTKRDSEAARADDRAAEAYRDLGIGDPLVASV